jgi:hypothetical protein
MATINPGYMGYANLDGNMVRFTDASIALQQDVNVPDLIGGTWDRMAWVAGPIQLGGSISGPITESFAGASGGVWDIATKRTGRCGELSNFPLEIYYYCGSEDTTGRRFPDAMIQSLSVSCSAGDVANFSIEVIGAGTPSPLSGWAKQTLEEKLVTWDICSVSGGPGDIVSSFELTINNNIEAVYAIGDGANYFPYALIPGIRQISGSITYYNVPSDIGNPINYDSAHENQGELTFNLGGGDFKIKAAFHRVVPSSSIGPIMSTVAFTGVGDQSALLGES